MRGVVLLFLVGCSSSTPAGDGGMDATADAESGAMDASADAKAPARAAVKASFSPADAGCSGALLSVGTLPDGLVDDGAMMTSVACSVHPMGQMFQATLTVNLGGSPSGMDLVGTVTASGNQTMDVMIRDTMGMPINKMMCTGTYPTNGGVSAGKIWIQLQCMPSMDPPPMNCPVSVEVRAENCKL